MDITMVYITHYTVGVPYEDEGLHGALDLGSTVLKWTQGEKKPDRQFIFSACLENTTCIPSSKLKTVCASLVNSIFSALEALVYLMYAYQM